MKRPGPLDRAGDLPGRSAGAGEPAAAAGAGAEPPSSGLPPIAELLNLPPALAKLVRGLEPMLGAHLARLPDELARRASAASDADLARLAATLASREPRAARRLAFHLIAASVLELEGFEPAELKVRAVHVLGAARIDVSIPYHVPQAPPADASG